MKSIGFIGLGIMGKPMAINLQKAGYKLIVYDININATKPLVDGGAVAASSPADVAQQSDITITMLPNSNHVHEVVLGVNGIIKGAKSGHLLIDMSSIAPDVSIQLSKELSKYNISMIDAPVSGGEPKAIEGTLAIMVGGDKENYEKALPILTKMGSSITHVGSIGSGNITKIANQMIVALNIAAIGEAMVLAKKAGVDPSKVFHAIKSGLAGSAVLDSKMPKILSRDFKPGFKITLHIKDLQNAMDTAHNLDVPVPLTAFVLEILHALQNEGDGLGDHCSIIKYYERLAKIEIK